MSISVTSAQPSTSADVPSRRAQISADPPRSARPVRRRRPSPLGALRLVVLFGFAVFCIVPLVWLLLAPTNTDAELLDGNPMSFGSIDRLVAAWNHLADYNNGVIFLWMGNSLLYCAAGMVIAITTALLAGYALATIDFPGRRVLLVATLLAMVLPATAVVLPLFLELNAVGLTNTALSVILPAAFYPFGVYLAFVYFSTSIPKAVLEAAAIDGCGPFRTFYLVVLPLSRPLIGLVAFFSFIANWGNYFLPYVMLTDESLYNLPVGLGVLLGTTPGLHPEAGGSYIPITRPEVALAGLIVVVPIAILFIAFQRFLMRGILAGAVKS